MSTILREKAITVTVYATGDNENTPEEAVHHALSMAHKQGFIQSWSEPLSSEGESGEAVAWRVKINDNGKIMNEYTERLPFAPLVGSGVKVLSEPEPLYAAPSLEGGEYVRVPKEPTNAMIAAGTKVADFNGCDVANRDAFQIYQAMIAAAPSQVSGWVREWSDEKGAFVWVDRSDPSQALNSEGE